jgi:hypothetical protein
VFDVLGPSIDPEHLTAAAAGEFNREETLVASQVETAQAAPVGAVPAVEVFDQHAPPGLMDGPRRIREVRLGHRAVGQPVLVEPTACEDPLA